MPVCDEVTVTVKPSVPERIRVVKVDVSAPSEVTAGEEFTVSVTVELEQAPPSGTVYSADLTVYVDGSYYGYEAVKLTEKVSTLDVKLTLHEGGSHTIRICLSDYATLSSGGVK